MNPIERLLTNTRTIRLTDEVRTRMREELLAYAELHAVTEQPAAPQTHHSFFARHFRVYSGLAAMVIILGGAGATAFASESSLPGDTLYGVKTNITEPIQTALIPSVKGKAAWHAILAERRLEEAAQLAAADKLSAKAQEELAVNLDAQVNASVANANRLQRSGDSIGSLDVRSDLEARLTAHEQILNIMATHLAVASSTDAKSSGEAVQHLLAIVDKHKESVQGTRLALEHELVPTLNASESTRIAASGEAGSATMMTMAADDTSSEGGAGSGSAEDGDDIHALRFSKMDPAARVAGAETARTEEIDHILTKHSALLAKFMTATSTMATSTTATTTASTTIKVQIPK